MRGVAAKLVFLFCVMVGVAAFAAGDDQGAPPAGGAGQGAGGRGGAAAPTNLKVLPKEWTRQQVQAVMNTFVESLGVSPQAGGEGCAFCHATDTAAPPPAAGRGPALDYASDAKKEKEVARAMMKMTMAVNADGLSGVGDAAVKEKVSCFTCHAGQKKPLDKPAAGWGRGSFTLIPPGPVVPARGGGAPGGGAPGGGGRGQ